MARVTKANLKIVSLRGGCSGISLGSSVAEGIEQKQLNLLRA